MNLSTVFGVVGRACRPVETELALWFSVVEPPKAHVHWLVFSSHDFVVGAADGGGVLGMYGK